MLRPIAKIQLGPRPQWHEDRPEELLLYKHPQIVMFLRHNLRIHYCGAFDIPKYIIASTYRDMIHGYNIMKFRNITANRHIYLFEGGYYRRWLKMPLLIRPLRLGEVPLFAKMWNSFCDHIIISSYKH